MSQEPSLPAEPSLSSSPRPSAPMSLGAKMSADYEAIRNDFEQAREIASDLQREVAGKANELAAMKQAMERAATDFARLEGTIAQMRKDRHDLANRVMMAQAVEIRLKKATAEGEEAQAKIRSLQLENSQLLTKLEAMRLHGNGTEGGKPSLDHTVNVSLAKILATVEVIRQSVDLIPKRNENFLEVTFDR